MTLHKAILDTLRTAERDRGGRVSMTAAEIAEAIPAPLGAVQGALHELDEQKAVIMRNGFYRLSEREREAAG